MRALALAVVIGCCASVAVLGGCSLYFETPRQADDDPDPGADAATPIPSFNIYIKASNTDPYDAFGASVAMSADGSTLAVAAPREQSSATGVDGPQSNGMYSDIGAVYVFARQGSTWTQQAYLKPGMLASGNFGTELSISADGSAIVVGQPFAPASGVAYVFRRTGVTWVLEQRLAATFPQDHAFFGFAVAISGDASTIAVGAYDENSTNQQELQTFAGAVHVFTHGATGWSETASFAAADTRPYDYFGYDVAISHDGSVLAVGAMGGNQGTGSAYVFARHDSTWTQQAKLVAANAENVDYFGVAIAISGDGTTVAVGAPREDGAGNALPESGAVYVFTRQSSTWSQAAYLQASNAGGGSGTGSGSGSSSGGDSTGDELGWAIALSPSGSRLVAGAWREASAATGIDGNQHDNSMPDAGAVYIFDRTTTWQQRAYVKASNTDADDNFGHAVSIAEAGAVAVGAPREASAAVGIGGDESNNAASNAGAVYAFTLP